MTNLGARQMDRQWQAFGLALGFGRWCGQLRQLGFHRRQIGVEGVLEQLALFHRPVFGLGAKTPALVQRQFVGQLIDFALAPVQFLVLIRKPHFLFNQQNA